MPARAVILYNYDTNATTGDPNSHTAAPTGSFSNSGWIYQGDFVAGFPVSGTAIGPHTFITAAHVNPTAGTTFTYNGGTYSVTSGTVIANRDLAIVQVNGTLPFWAPLYNAATDGSLVGKTVVDMGRGTQRGDAIHTTPARTGDPDSGTLRGWVWGPEDDRRRWGTNVINDVFTDTDSKEYIRYSFDRSGLTDEATLSGGDSGGGMFVKAADGVWKLAGANSGVDPAYFRYAANTPTTPVDPLPGSVFDFTDLYLEGTDLQYRTAQSYFPGQSPIPQLSYVANISDLPASTFAAYVPHAGDINVDGKVNALDFNVLASHFNMTGAVWTQGDLNYDGVVNALDFNILADNFGYSGVAPGLLAAGGSPTAGVPEPATLLMLATLPVLLKRRRLM